MSTYIKELIQGELEQKVSDGKVKEFLVVSLMGVGGVDNNAMRGDLKQKGVQMFVVKNSLFKRALRNQNLDSAGSLFAGPCAVAIGGDSIVDAAKELVGWTKKVKTLELKGAFVDGTVLDAVAAVDLSKMPTLKELQSQMAGVITSPASRLAATISSQGSQISGYVKAIIEKAEKNAA